MMMAHLFYIAMSFLAWCIAFVITWMSVRKPKLIHYIQILSNKKEDIMEKQIISTENAPKAIGPYSQGIAYGDLIFTSGQLPMDPATGKMVDGGIKAATTQVLKNVQAILHEADSSLDKVLRVTVYLKDMGDFAAMNETYAEFFGANPPARTTFQVAKLPMDVAVEIDVIAGR